MKIRTVVIAIQKLPISSGIMEKGGIDQGLKNIFAPPYYLPIL